MGKITVNNKEYDTPKQALTVREVKELARIPQKNKVYNASAEILDDSEIVELKGEKPVDLGEIPDWSRGTDNN